LSTPVRIPAPPTNLFKHHVVVDATTAFEGSNDQTTGFRRSDAGEARHRSGQEAHDVPDGQRTMAEENVRKVVLGQEGGRDGAMGVEAGQSPGIDGVSLVRSSCMLDGILEVDVGVDDGVGRRSGRGRGDLVLERLRRQRRGDGRRGRRQVSSVRAPRRCLDEAWGY